ncbi:TetR family transcriptional regulator [Nocardioides speluncae]|uniref:TetR family transcriptional regulator n=1 Tax=Nocardioides speluncae TaxID=2670337 RepID=UPI000D697B4D|nr:TetR family transcriptional regulator [Nocardioides speluncae]
MSTRPDAREELLLAAERLVAERGISVSLREVAAAAGQRNNSAVAYHFGSKDDLVAAIVARRLEAIETERVVLLATDDLEPATAPEDRVRQLVRVLIRPMLTTPYAEGSTHYARFLEKVRDHPAVVEMPLTDDRWPAIRTVTRRLDGALGDLPAAVRRRRLAALTSVMFALLADAERRGEIGESAQPVTEAAVVDMLVGLLTAPAGPPPRT